MALNFPEQGLGGTGVQRLVETQLCGSQPLDSGFSFKLVALKGTPPARPPQQEMLMEGKALTRDHTCQETPTSGEPYWLSRRSSQTAAGS